MFEYIRGLVTYVSSGGIVIEQNGIGYQILCANPFSFQSALKQETTVYLYQYVREDALILYGFKTRKERDLFIKLLSVSGIGPKNALAILASEDPGQIVRAIEMEDNAYLTRFPGIGKKSAGQIILDLKGKLKSFSSSEIPVQQAESKTDNDSEALSEAIEALKMLGYSEREIKKVTPALKKQNLNAESYLKEALHLITKR